MPNLESIAKLYLIDRLPPPRGRAEMIKLPMPLKVCGKDVNRQRQERPTLQINEQRGKQEL